MTSLSKTLSGVIAAIATPIDENGAPDLERAVKLARFLLDNGCDGLNVLGTTGEATSFSLDERKGVMGAYKANGLPLHRLMVGTGAAAVADAVALTRHAAELGFAGALVLPPFYYKGVPDDGLVAYIDTSVKATAAKPIPIYLYHFPAMSGLPWHVALIAPAARIHSRPHRGPEGFLRRHGLCALGRGDLARLCGVPLDRSLRCSRRARGDFAGCISATANLNADLCARAWRERRCRRARRGGRDPQAVRRQATGPGREGAARAYPWRSGAGAGEAAAGAVLRRRPRGGHRRPRRGARQARGLSRDARGR